MKSQKNVVLGIYKTRTEVETCINDLKKEGISTSEISVLMPDSSGSQNSSSLHKGSKAPEGAATGAGTGAVFGGALGILAGIGALAIPGVGPFVAAGPIMAALAGAGVGGTLGGIGGALIGLGIPESEAKDYEGDVKNGGLLLSVHASSPDEAFRIRQCLEKNGAKDIMSTGHTQTDMKSGQYQTNSATMKSAT